MAPVPSVVKERPAETATPITMAVALLIAKAVGIDDASTIAYIAIIVAFVPAAITWLVDTIRKPKAAVSGK